MDEPVQLDQSWLRDNPLPPLPPRLDKNSRGRVLIIGGSPKVPGGLALTAEAALRAGAGKVQLAAPEAIGVGLGMLVPEAGVISIPQDMEKHDDLLAAMNEADCVVIGPAMTSNDHPAELLTAVIENLPTDATLLVDAAAIECVPKVRSQLARVAERVVLTPNLGEMAALLDRDIEVVQDNPAASLGDAVETFGTTIVLKDTQTRIRAPSGAELHYSGGGPGLATGGSGDVLAGIMGGILSRTKDPLCAAGWGVWLHGEAGSTLRSQVGELGFLAREIAPLVPSLLDQAQARSHSK